MAKIVLKDFFAAWCPPCKLQAPIIEALEKEMGKKVSFEEIDIDKNASEAGEFNVMAVPTTIILRDGKEVRRFVGLIQKDALKKALEEAMK